VTFIDEEQGAALAAERMPKLELGTEAASASRRRTAARFEDIVSVPSLIRCT
jgi:hypothetical protein